MENVRKILWGNAMKNFVKRYRVYAYHVDFGDTPTQGQQKVFSMLQSLVAPVITLAASIWIDSDLFFDSVKQLSTLTAILNVFLDIILGVPVCI